MYDIEVSDQTKAFGNIQNLLYRDDFLSEICFKIVSMLRNINILGFNFE